MATADGNGGAAVHPLETYTRAYTSAHAQMVSERVAQEGVRDDPESQQTDIDDARVAVDDLNSKIGLMSDANAAFLVKIFTGEIAPDPTVVTQTVDMDTQLAAVIVKANRPAAMIQIVTAFLGGAISVYTGAVAAAGS